MTTVTPEQLYCNANVEVVERANAIGLTTILDERKIVRDTLGQTVLCTIPSSGGESDTVTLRGYPYANGRSDHQSVIDRIVAETTGTMVFSFPMQSSTDRNIHNVTQVRDWYRDARQSRDDEEVATLRRYMSEGLLIDFGQSIRKSLANSGILQLLIDRGITVDITGDSAAAATGLGMALVLSDEVQVGTVSELSLPTVEDRDVWLGLFREFAGVGSIREQVCDGPVMCDPLVEALGYDQESSWLKGKLGDLNYLVNDMFGGPRLRNYPTNMALSRALCASSAPKMVQDLLLRDVVVRLGFFEHDQVAKPDKALSALSHLTMLSGFHLEKYPGVGHTAGNNPYIVANSSKVS